MNYLLSLGSNIGQKRGHLARALAALENAGVRVTRMSSVYRTQPVDVAAQPWFYNMAVEVATPLGPGEFLGLVKKIETEMGRGRACKSGPRVIDIDILLAGPLIIRTPRLNIPHLRLEKRNFVLVPLAEIAASAVHPVIRKTISALLRASTDRSAVRKLKVPFQQSRCVRKT